MVTFHPLASITPLPGYKLDARFLTGERKIYDAGQLEKRWADFADFKVIRGLFELAHLAPGGYGVIWNERLDLSSEEIWAHGEPCAE